MSTPEFDQTSDDAVRICPYCGDSYQPEAADYSDDTREETCDGCGKKYYATDDFSVTHYAKPDCSLNGESHEWKDIFVTPGLLLRCAKCGVFKKEAA